MIHQVPLPALDGRDPLGFLAALGVLRLLHGTRLSFSDTDGVAILHGPYDSTDGIARALQQALHSVMPGAVVPDAPADFPRAKAGSGPDPMRVTRQEFRELAEASASTPESQMWLSSLVTDLAVDKKGRIAISPLMAPSGQQSIRTFLATPLEATRAQPHRLHEALTHWRRVEDFTGEYLDHRVLNNSADHPTGRSTESGVPGATWLAIMAMPLLRVTGDGKATVSATCWHRPAGLRTSVMIWPLWHHPLSPAAVRAMLEHPAIRPQVNNRKLQVNPLHLEELGIFHIAAADRQLVEGRKFAGALAPRQIGIAPVQRASSRTTLDPVSM